ncbi:alpha/beta hydrolase family protein [Gluconacetobacter takamatsuzukensis]|uniref:Alpha/beta hydrolase n=1 Tax=Gluconacetobacter takamatsuzukensis TaxID=1286190 RepID=A0A7W4KEM8_9PROT|nr:alpha/beta fold hydrolase [Gluconacetobacter takamatsuzukensis]MBB2205490.1 alpha/beta hydrolase [Gluconacetobacter takamatsuzukensis]
MEQSHADAAGRAAHTVGYRGLTVHDAVQDAAIALAILYPAAGTPQRRRFGPYFLPLSDGPVAGGDRPLVVLSHGNGGSPWVYRDLAMALAARGFVIAMPKHPGNSLNDDGLARTQANLENRPRHVCLSIAAAFADPVVGPALRPGRVALIGHSLGTYTVLAAAGGQPWSGGRGADDPPRRIAVTHDRHVRALVLLAPATGWFRPAGALSAVRCPILMRTAAEDDVTPPALADIVMRGVPDPALVDNRCVPGAGHFSFLSPFPANMVRPDFAPSQDPPGFDRAAFQPVMAEEIGAFLHRTMAGPA